MNNQEAIQELIAFYGYYAGELREECNMAISALERQLELESLGFTEDIIENYKIFEDELIAKGFTFNSLIEAREKQIPKKPRDGSRAVIAGIDGANCGNCGGLIFMPNDFCGKCGQAIDWEVKDE